MNQLVERPVQKAAVIERLTEELMSGHTLKSGRQRICLGDILAKTGFVNPMHVLARLITEDRQGRDDYLLTIERQSRILVEHFLIDDIRGKGLVGDRMQSEKEQARDERQEDLEYELTDALYHVGICPPGDVIALACGCEYSRSACRWETECEKHRED